MEDSGQSAPYLRTEVENRHLLIITSNPDVFANLGILLKRTTDFEVESIPMFDPLGSEFVLGKYTVEKVVVTFAIAFVRCDDHLDTFAVRMTQTIYSTLPRYVLLVGTCKPYTGSLVHRRTSSDRICFASQGINYNALGAKTFSSSAASKLYQGLNQGLYIFSCFGRCFCRLFYVFLQ